MSAFSELAAFDRCRNERNATERSLLVNEGDFSVFVDGLVVGCVFNEFVTELTDLNAVTVEFVTERT